MKLIERGEVSRAQGCLLICALRSGEFQDAVGKAATAVVVGSDVRLLRHLCLPVAPAAADDDDQQPEQQVDADDPADAAQFLPRRRVILAVDRATEAAP